MSNRTALQTMLEGLLDSPNVYFQPPESLRLVYPCIIYKLGDIDTTFASNKPYSYGTKYSLTVIDKNPDTTIIDKVKALPLCAFDRYYTADNLNHYSFNLYY